MSERPPIRKFVLPVAAGAIFFGGYEWGRQVQHYSTTVDSATVEGTVDDITQQTRKKTLHLKLGEAEARLEAADAELERVNMKINMLLDQLRKAEDRSMGNTYLQKREEELETRKEDTMPPDRGQSRSRFWPRADEETRTVEDTVGDSYHFDLESRKNSRSESQP